MLTLKHLRTLQHVSILIDHHLGVRRCLVKATEFKKKKLNLKFLKVALTRHRRTPCRWSIKIETCRSVLKCFKVNIL